jgi:uncharacterized caspase-like protein
MKSRRIQSLLLIVCLALITPAHAYEERPALHALVIGNNAYPMAPLRNSINDANAIAGQLEEQGFIVTKLLDVGGGEMQSEVEQFYRRLKNDDEEPNEKRAVGLVYYAGHAVQINHRNYLVPLDIQFGEPERFVDGLFDINSLLSSIPESGNIQSVIILDACRDNPFAGMEGMDESVKINDGLAPIRAPVGTLIAYSTEPGATASDGKGKNGLYATHLLKHMDDKIPIEEVFKKVRKGVAKQSKNRQIPWEHSSLLWDVFINAPLNKEVPDLLTY